jgi:hypothetical protein
MRHICCVALGIWLAAGPGVVLADSQDQRPKKSRPIEDALIIRQVDPTSRGAVHPPAAQSPGGAPPRGSATKVVPPSTAAASGR